MKRLLVLIGVRQPGGGLGALESIKKCLVDMRDWALSQQIPRGDIKIFTDISELVEPGDPKQLSVSHIYDWIEARATEAQPADQLVIYFSGHGMQSGGAPLWLLPHAPEKIWEAVNLLASTDLAICSRFKHVVFIGDCCSTVADNVQFDFVKGASIFKNMPEVERIKDRPVDFLRAARPGKESLEVLIDGVPLSPYTVQLVKALGGAPTTILEPQTAEAAQPLVLRVRKLADELRTSVNSFLRSNRITPPGPPFDSVVSTSQWIALFPTLQLPTQPLSQIPPPPAQAPVPPGSGSLPLAPQANAFGPAPSSAASSDQLGQSKEDVTLSLDTELIEIASGARPAIGGVDWSSNIPDGYHYETECGFFVTGASVLSAESRPDVYCTVLSDQEIRIHSEVTELVSIEFQDGGGIMIPAIPHQIGFIHVENGRLTSLAYEPSGHADVAQKSAFRRDFEAKSQRIRNLRDTLLNVVTGDELSFTDIHPDTILDVIRNIQYGWRVDFSTLLYLAYAAYTSKLGKRVIPSLANYMQHLFGFVPFDIKVLLSLAQIEPVHYLEFAPPFPLLTRGWSFLQATHEQLPEELTELPSHSRNTSWTHLDSVGVELCRSYLARQRTSGTSGESGNMPSMVEGSATIAGFEEPTVWLEQAAEVGTLDATPQASIDEGEERGLTMS